MSDETMQAKDNDNISQLTVIRGGRSTIDDPDLQKTVTKLENFTRAYGQYHPVVGDVVRSLPGAYVGKHTTGECGMVLEVHDYTVNTRFELGNNPRVYYKFNMSVAYVDPDGDILVYDQDSAYFELVLRK